jgi:hypothetical protein
MLNIIKGTDGHKYIYHVNLLLYNKCKNNIHTGIPEYRNTGVLAIPGIAGVGFPVFDHFGAPEYFTRNRNKISWRPLSHIHRRLSSPAIQTPGWLSGWLRAALTVSYLDYFTCCIVCILMIYMRLYSVHYILK